METIKSLKNESFDSLFLAFNEAFKDYEMQLTKEELQVMLHRRGFNAELSFGAFEQDKLVAFTFNGIGVFNGIKTAYDTGTGTIEAYRGKGLATRIFEYSIPFLKEADISQYLLEVLQHNTKAVSVYKNLGFVVSREFNYYRQKTEEIHSGNHSVNSSFRLQPVDLSMKETMMQFWEFIPSWQNSFDAIARKPDDFIMTGAFTNQTLVGYCIFEPGSGDLTQLAVDKNYRRKGVASLLLNQALKSNRHHSVKAINTEVDCHSISDFLQSKGIPLTGKQFEMIRPL